MARFVILKEKSRSTIKIRNTIAIQLIFLTHKYFVRSSKVPGSPSGLDCDDSALFVSLLYSRSRKL